MANVMQVESTVGSRKAGAELATALVERRLAACVQVIGPISSTYWWEGAVETEEEFLLLCKTDRERVNELTEMLTELHEYDVPEVLAFRIEGGHRSYMEWVRAETEPR